MHRPPYKLALRAVVHTSSHQRVRRVVDQLSGLYMFNSVWAGSWAIQDSCSSSNHKSLHYVCCEDGFDQVLKSPGQASSQHIRAQ